MPNDEIEQLRLAITHQVFIHVLDGELTNAPLEDPTHVLDIGTGTGDWAIRMAEVYPKCEVVGTDISAIAETSSVPMNVFFEIEDAEDWDRPPDSYDLIHMRYLDGSFRDWSFMYESVFYSTKPGGWIEVMDFDTPDAFSRFATHFSPTSPVHEIFRDMLEASNKAGRECGVKHLNPMLLLEAGFVDVRVTEYPIPLTVAEHTAGKIWLISCLDAFEAMCLRLLIEQMGWDPDECKLACEHAARELAELAKNPEVSKGLFIVLRSLVGRKPLHGPASGALSAQVIEEEEEAMEGIETTDSGTTRFAPMETKLPERLLPTTAEEAMPQPMMMETVMEETTHNGMDTQIRGDGLERSDTANTAIRDYGNTTENRNVG